MSGGASTTFESGPALAPVLVEVRDAARHFDVSQPWLERLVKRMPRTTLRAVDGVSFTLRRGETLGLVGESGCGKSTVARLLVGLHALTAGSIAIDGQPVAMLVKPEGQALRRRVQMIFQDPYASLNPQWRVGRIVGEGLRVHGVRRAREAARDAGVAESASSNARAISARIDALLQQVGLSAADRNKYPHQFSGGQRQRISIARALATDPDFLVCDEPTSALDVSVQAQVLNLMKDLQIEHGLTYLFISHNLAVVHHMADRVGVMYLGRIVELGTNRAVFETPLHPYTRMLIEAIPDLEAPHRSDAIAASGEVPSPLQTPSGCAFHPRCRFANARCVAEQPQLLRQANGTEVACHAIEEARI